MKVLIIRNPWRQNDYGGAELLAIDLVNELTSQNIESTFISGGEATIAHARARSVPLIKGPFSNHQVLTKHRGIFLPLYLYDLGRARKVYFKIFKEHTPDLIHTTGQQDSIAATSAARELGIPVVWSDHGELKNSIGLKLLPPFGIPGFLLKRQLENIQNLFMVNPVDVAFVKSVSPKTCIEIVPNGIAEPKFAHNGKNYDLVFASRVIREKGVFELVKAFSQLLKTRPDSTLAIAGTGPSLDKIHSLVESQKIQNIDFLPFKDDIPHGKLFVLPTYTEAQSLTILKAMALKMPIITTNIDGNTHFLTHKKTAYLVEPQDAQSLHDGIVYMLDHDRVAQIMVENAYKLYQAEYSLRSVVKKHYLPLYNRVISKFAR